MKPSHLLVAVVLALLDTVPLPARQPAALQSSDLAGLRLRNIGPATMSGRVVDMDVVESDPYTMYASGVSKATPMGPRLLPCNVTHSPPCMPPPPKKKKGSTGADGR